MKKIILLHFLWFISLPSFAQNKILSLAPELRWPKDTAEFKNLVQSLNEFVLAARGPNDDNVWLSPEHKAQTYVMMDEFTGIEQELKSNLAHFYKPYLINVVALPEHQYRLDLVYLGRLDSSETLRAHFELMAQKAEKGFVFSSPLIYNTRSWKTLHFGKICFHYRDSINMDQVKKYVMYSEMYDKKLKSEGKKTDLYCCEDYQELQKITGVLYKLDYNGRSIALWTGLSGDSKVLVLGNHNAHFSDFDPHDLWHDRLAMVLPRAQANRPVDEGCAYLYGGSWGFTWPEILKAFKEQVASDPKTDWKVIKEKPLNFKLGEYMSPADYIVNALLVKKIEQERGFEGVMEFLKCGKYEKGNANYYKALEKLTGITEANYNQEIWKLVKGA